MLAEWGGVGLATLLSDRIGSNKGRTTSIHKILEGGAAPAAPLHGGRSSGRLFDSKSGQMLTRQVVLIQGERITDVGPEGRIAIPAGARVIDLSRATVMPGFIDGHSHVFESAPAKGQTLLNVGFEAAASAEDCLLAGFTTMRDAGSHGNGNADVAVRDAIDRGEIIGPRLSIATRSQIRSNDARVGRLRAHVSRTAEDGATISIHTRVGLFLHARG